MSGPMLIADILMCCFWIATECLCLYGTKKYKKAIMSPFSQILLTPLELSIAILLLTSHESNKYVTISYTCWAVIEFLTIRLYFKHSIVPKKWRKWYIFSIICLLITFISLFTHVDDSLFILNCFVTMLAIIVWYVHVFSPSYPITNLTLIIFFLKLIGDILANIVYLNSSLIIVKCSLIILMTVDFCFIPTWFILRHKRKHTDNNKPIAQQKVHNNQQSIKKKYNKK